MFQNENVIRKENSKLNVFSNVFAIKNVVLYIISFMLSMVGLGGEFSVFSISMLGACLASSVPVLGIILVSLIILVAKNLLLSQFCNNFEPDFG